MILAKQFSQKIFSGIFFSNFVVLKYYSSGLTLPLFLPSEKRTFGHFKVTTNKKPIT